MVPDDAGVYSLTTDHVMLYFLWDKLRAAALRLAVHMSIEPWRFRVSWLAVEEAYA